MLFYSVTAFFEQVEYSGGITCMKRLKFSIQIKLTCLTVDMANKTANLKTLKKWEEEFKTKFSYDLSGGKVSRIRCVICGKWEQRIKNCKNFSSNWIRSGTECVSKDSVKKHVESTQHKEAVNLNKRSELGADAYKESVIQNSAIGRSLSKLRESDREGLRVKINTIYHLIKNERPYSDYPKLLELQTKNMVPELQKRKVFLSYATDDAGALFGDYIGKSMMQTLKDDISKINYYSVLTDGSTDSSVTEQEAIYVLFLHDGRPKVRYFSIENVKHADAPGLLASIQEAFSRFGISRLENRIVGLNADGASVNMGLLNGLGKLVKEKAPWLELVHCFNHRLELAMKDAFQTTPFSKIDDMLLRLYYLYQKSPKRYRELKELCEVYDKIVPKPSKAHGTRWIDHKYRAMEKVIDNYGIYIAHLESLSVTDSQALKRAELQGNVKKWSNALYPVYMSIYLDILAPIRRISVAMQQDVHDPVKVIRRIKEFGWTMSKLILIVEQSLSDNNVLTFYKKNLSVVTVNEEEKHYYQGVHMKHYNRTTKAVQKHYVETVANICESVKGRFANILVSPIFKNIEVILDTFTWPISGDCASFGNLQISELTNHFSQLLQNNGCDTTKIDPEWLTLKSYAVPLIQNQNKKDSKYLDIWAKVFQSPSIQEECRNVLHILEVLLVVPFTNAKVERLFSRMNRVKTDSRNRLAIATD